MNVIIIGALYFTVAHIVYVKDMRALVQPPVVEIYFIGQPERVRLYELDADHFMKLYALCIQAYRPEDLGEGQL